MARERGLAAAERAESQEICFVPGDDYAGFLARRSPAGAFVPGAIVDTAGRRLGEHRGLAHYTVGQRRGLGVAAGRPLYVVALDAADKRLVVGADADLWRRDLVAAGVNWLVDEPAGEFRAAVRIRSRHEPAPATLAPAGEGAWRVQFDEPQRAITPGQAAVFYDGDTVLGGGWIQDRQRGGGRSLMCVYADIAAPASTAAEYVAHGTDLAPAGTPSIGRCIPPFERRSRDRRCISAP